VNGLLSPIDEQAETAPAIKMTAGSARLRSDPRMLPGKSLEPFAAKPKLRTLRDSMASEYAVIVVPAAVSRAD